MTIKAFTLCFNEDHAFFILSALEKERNALRAWLDAVDEEDPNYNEGSVEFVYEQWMVMHKQCQILANQLHLDTSTRYEPSPELTKAQRMIMSW